MKIAVDAQIVLRNAARRMVFGSAELSGTDVIVPETTAEMAKQNYAKVSRHYIEDQVEWEDERNGTSWSSEKIGEEIAKRLARVVQGFERWIDDEPLRNDSAFSTAKRTPRAEALAMEIARAGVVTDPDDERWEIGEDPYVLGGALEAGAHWMASDNFKTLSSEAMEEWLDEVQHKGRLLHVPRPFILTAEKALETMIATVGASIGDGTLSAREHRRILANAVSRPTDPETNTARRVQILTKMGRDIRRAGLRRTGKELHQWQVRKMAQMRKGWEDVVGREIAWMDTVMTTRQVERTRAGEDRRRQAEDECAGPPPSLDIRVQGQGWNSATWR